MNTSTGVIGVDVLVIWSAAAVAIAGLLALLWRAVRALVRLVGRMDEVIDDWQGTPSRPGVPGRLGVMARLDRIEHELHPNSGASLRDALDRVEQCVTGSSSGPEQ
ncbi:hypothetical protein P3T36_006909 [Kitasatospora sp. MAP12-15]|uniref:hypothetical protein n=1 Tax=unclassified Kitasatospora TaxID=2633591 RepID=UPI002476FCF7|nr:hypothetical protein [Kitasatospora sp. MAP12-44]MDH6111908.1 hypothetical protein [Kitasatospora sp. MAP12-44]